MRFDRAQRWALPLSEAGRTGYTHATIWFGWIHLYPVPAGRFRTTDEETTHEPTDALSLAGLALLPLPASSTCDSVDLLTARDGQWSVFRFMKPGGHHGVTVSLVARQVESTSRVEAFAEGSWTASKPVSA